MEAIKINERISYLPPSNEPLSANIGIIKGKEFNYLYDVGNGVKNIESLKETYNVIISHFHLDHLGNILNLKINKLYVSKETYKHLPKEILERSEIIIVDKEVVIEDLRIFLIPSSHASGSLGLEVNNSYAFLGDATYAKVKNGKLSYNAQLLKEEIKTLKDLKAKTFLISHYTGFKRSKDEVIKELEAIYASRDKNNSLIFI